MLRNKIAFFVLLPLSFLDVIERFIMSGTVVAGCSLTFMSRAKSQNLKVPEH